jgi:hypothetical protein
MEGMAFADSFERQPKPLANPVFFDGLYAVFGTSREKPTTVA